jgi:hypothetical protein
MKNIFSLFGRRFRKWYQPDANVKERLESLARCSPGQISCEDVFWVLDQFATAVDQGENVLLLMPIIRQHLDICPACRDQYEHLLSGLQPKAD